MLKGRYYNRICILAVSTVTLWSILNIFGVIEQFYEVDFDSSFSYPYDGYFKDCVAQLSIGKKPRIKPFNEYPQTILEPAAEKCRENRHLVLIVKSAAGNFEKRKAIRETWGADNRFPGNNISTVFIVGVVEDGAIKYNLQDEINIHQDIVQIDFFDSYFNNTLKTMNSMKWALKFCENSKFYAFIDDDMYLSVKNLLRFLNNPGKYPEWTDKVIKPHLFYAGNVELTYPRREKMSKWYVPISEYPFNKWPPFIPAGCYILSYDALQVIYYTSLYTKMFRFDDIFLSLVAYKAGIKMTHSDYFHMHSDPNNKYLDFREIIAFHGLKDPFEKWNQLLVTNNV